MLQLSTSVLWEITTSHWNAYLHIILFFLVWAYFHCKLIFLWPCLHLYSKYFKCKFYVWKHSANYININRAVEYADCISADSLDPTPNECPRYDIKPSYSEVPILELWRICNTPSLPLLPVLLWPKVVVPVRVPLMVQMEICNHFLNLKPFNCVHTNYWF